MTMDAEGNPKVAVPEKGEESAGNQGDSKAKEKTYTESEVEKKFSAQRSALDKKIAEMSGIAAKAAKTAEAAEVRAAAAEKALAEAERAKEEAEYERVRGNPDALTDFQAKKAIKEARAELVKKEAELARSREAHSAELAELASWKTTQAAMEIAGKHPGVDYKDLIELTDGSAEKMEKMAKKLETTIPPAKPPAAKKPEGENAQEPEEITEPDSGDGQGSSGQPTAKQLEEMSPEEYREWASKRYK